MNGWIKLHRKMLDNPVVMNSPENLALWVYLLLNASHDEHYTMFGGKKIALQAGQLATGRKKLAKILHCNEYKIERILSCFESERMIAQTQKSGVGRIITITAWSEYQIDAQTNAQTLHELCTNSARTLHTKQEREEGKEEKEISSSSSDDVVDAPQLSIDKKQIIGLWNGLSSFGIQPIRSIDGKRADNTRARIRQYGMDGFEEAIDNVRHSDFLQGISTGFVLTYDWFIKPSNFPKVLEGNYNRQRQKAAGANQSQGETLNDVLRRRYAEAQEMEGLNEIRGDN